MTMPSKALRAQWSHSNRLRLSLALGLGIVSGLLALTYGHQDIALLVGGDVGALVYVVWVYLSAMRLDGQETCVLSTREDSGRASVDTVVLLACLSALGAVAEVLIRAKGEKGLEQDVLAGIGAFSVVCAWLLVHTIFALRYARLYYEGEKGGIDFNSDEDPTYSDFAYLAFTLGMTFQVSDTAISDREIRATALRHALLSYLFGTVIVATTINLVAGLGQ